MLFSLSYAWLLEWREDALNRLYSLGAILLVHAMWLLRRLVGARVGKFTELSNSIPFSWLVGSAKNPLRLITAVGSPVEKNSASW